jgi:hypothetical protein
MIGLGLGPFGLVLGLWLRIGCSVFVLGFMEFRRGAKVSTSVWLWNGLWLWIGCLVRDLGLFVLGLRVKLIDGLWLWIGCIVRDLGLFVLGLRVKLIDGLRLGLFVLRIVD